MNIACGNYNYNNHCDYLGSDTGRESLALMRQIVTNEFNKNGGTIQARIAFFGAHIPNGNVVWKCMALFDRMVELKELEELTKKPKVHNGTGEFLWHERFFRKGKNWKNSNKDP